MESIPASANLNEFLHSIDTDLTKPRKKFLRDGLVGPPLADRLIALGRPLPRMAPASSRTAS